MRGSTRTRRRFLESAAGASVVALAGCLSPTTASDRTSMSDGHGHEATAHDHEPAGHGDEGSHHEATEESHDHEGALPEAPAESVEVGMLTTADGGHHFDPHVAWVEPGGTVTWTLESGIHTTTAYAPVNDRPRRIPEGTEPWDSGTMAEQGATYECTFGTEGVYDYVCLPHEGVGMVGSVLVGEPDPHDQPGMEDPASSLPEGARQRLTALNETVDALLGHHHDE